MWRSWLRYIEKTRLLIHREGLELLQKGAKMIKAGWIRHVRKKKNTVALITESM